jgi:hypothetical protein
MCVELVGAHALTEILYGVSIGKADAEITVEKVFRYRPIGLAMLYAVTVPMIFVCKVVEGDGDGRQLIDGNNRHGRPCVAGNHLQRGNTTAEYLVILCAGILDANHDQYEKYEFLGVHHIINHHFILWR